MRHFLSAADLTRDTALGLFALAADLKQRRKAGRHAEPLAAKTFALIFEKASLRTRVTFEVGIIQLGGRAVHLVGRDIDLGDVEFRMLHFLMTHPERVYSRAQLLDQVWGYSHSGYEHTVNSHINRLRNKIERDPGNPDYIQTVWGVGYKFGDRRA